MSSSVPSPSANSAPTTTPPTQQQHPDTEALARELAQLRAEMAKRAPPSVEEELRREIAALRAAAGGDSSVAEHLAREAAYRREPHRAKLDRRRAKLEGYAAGLEDNAGSWEALRREFATTARHQGVDPQDAVLLHCLLAPAPFRIRFARALLVNSAPAARAGFFNTLVLDGGPPEFAQAWAETVVDMPWPLFPVTPDFSELNGRLLRDWGAEVEGVTGAGPKKRTHPAVFAPSRAPEGLLNLVRGAGYAPVADGRADLSEVEAAFNAMAAEIGSLKAQVAELSRRGGGAARGRARGRASPQNQNNGGYNNGGYNNGGYNNGGYNNGGYNNGGYNQRGGYSGGARRRGGRTYGAGGEPDEESGNVENFNLNE